MKRKIVLIEDDPTWREIIADEVNLLLPEEIELVIVEADDGPGYLRKGKDAIMEEVVVIGVITDWNVGDTGEITVLQDQTFTTELIQLTMELGLPLLICTGSGESFARFREAQAAIGVEFRVFNKTEGDIGKEVSGFISEVLAFKAVQDGGEGRVHNPEGE